MVSCNKETSQDELRTIIKSVQLQDEGHINWISSLTNDPSVVDESEPKLPSDNRTTVDLKDIRRAQTTDKVIHKVLYTL
jgi:hypothetical protein